MLKLHHSKAGRDGSKSAVRPPVRSPACLVKDGKRTYRAGVFRTLVWAYTIMGAYLLVIAIATAVDGQPLSILVGLSGVALISVRRVGLVVSSEGVVVRNYLSSRLIEPDEFPEWEFVGPRAGIGSGRRCRFLRSDGETVFCTAAATMGGRAKERDDILELARALSDVGLRVQRDIKL